MKIANSRKAIFINALLLTFGFGGILADAVPRAQREAKRAAWRNFADQIAKEGGFPEKLVMVGSSPATPSSFERVNMATKINHETVIISLILRNDTIKEVEQTGEYIAGSVKGVAVYSIKNRNISKALNLKL